MCAVRGDVYKGADNCTGAGAVARSHGGCAAGVRGGYPGEEAGDYARGSAFVTGAGCGGAERSFERCVFPGGRAARAGFESGDSGCGTVSIAVVAVGFSVGDGGGYPGDDD